jgi:predicted MPP superfamily phosphohydrolase
VNEEDFVIFLGHNPDLLSARAQRRTARTATTHWFDLALFGHTHGGQLTFYLRPAADPADGAGTGQPLPRRLG